MTVFLSWSGPLAKAVAQLLDSWLPDVIQGVKTWLSSEDIEKGSIWSGEINSALATTVGILCVTQENKNAPWLLFEAGGLSKGLTKARVCPLLIDLQPKDLNTPLSLFNLTLPDEEDMWRLMRTINGAGGESALPEVRLEKAFIQWWPTFEKEFRAIREKYKAAKKAPERTVDDMVLEILEITRALQRNAEREHFVPASLVGGMSGLGLGSPQSAPIYIDPATFEVKNWRGPQGPTGPVSGVEMRTMFEGFQPKPLETPKEGGERGKGKPTNPAEPPKPPESKG